LDYLEGKVLAHSTQRHRHQEWIQFLRTIDKEVPADLEVHLILDNYATHRDAASQTVVEASSAAFIYTSPNQQLGG